MDYSYPLLASCERNLDRTAVISGEQRISYCQLERDIAGLTAGLRALVSTGQRVASFLLSEPETLEFYMALARLGAVSVPVNTRLTVDEKRYILEDSGCTVLVVDNDFLDEAEQLRELIPTISHVLSSRPSAYDDLVSLRSSAPEEAPTAWAGDESAACTIMYTSGTTGFPKGVVRSHRANVWNAVNSALGSPSTAEDVVLFNLPIFGIGFLHFALPALLSGSTLVLDRVFHPKRVWELLEKHRVTLTFLAPTMIAAMLDVDDQSHVDVSALRVIRTAYAFPERLRLRALDRFGDLFIHMYGLTEAQLTSALPRQFADKPANVGRAMGVMRLRVADKNGARVPDGVVGEILFEGPSIMTEYLNLSEQTRSTVVDGWVRTGDIGLIDADGDLVYVGRLKEMIKTGGFSVDPIEVENAILRLDAVVEASALGVADDQWGEMVVAFVAPAHNQTVTSDDIIEVCRQTIAGYKVPKKVFIVDELPKNATGKVERGVLRQWYSERSSSDGDREKESEAGR